MLINIITVYILCYVGQINALLLLLIVFKRHFCSVDFYLVCSLDEGDIPSNFAVSTPALL